MSDKTSLLLFWIKGWLWLFEHPKHLVLVVAPLFFGFGLVGLIGYLAFPYLPQMSSGAIQWLPYLLEYYLGSFFYWALLIVFLILFAGISVILLYCVYIILCAPFHSLLVEKALKAENKYNGAAVGFRGWLILTLRMLRTSIVKVLLFSSIGVVAFLISFIPGLQWVILVTTACILAFDSMDYSFETMGYGFLQRIRYFGQHKEQFFLLSLSMALTLLVPGLTFLALPGAVVGAALVVKPKELDSGQVV